MSAARFATRVRNLISRIGAGGSYRAVTVRLADTFDEAGLDREASELLAATLGARQAGRPVDVARLERLATDLDRRAALEASR